jgi:hypothetical protein
VTRLKPVLLGLFLACFVLDLLVFLRVLSLAGSLPMTLYGFYSVAIALGWLFGMLYERDRRNQPAPIRRRLFLIYFLGPPGILYLVRSMAPLTEQQAVPLAWLWSFGVFAILFSVPVKLPVTPR